MNQGAGNQPNERRRVSEATAVAEGLKDVSIFPSGRLDNWNDQIVRALKEQMPACSDDAVLHIGTFHGSSGKHTTVRVQAGELRAALDRWDGTPFGDPDKDLPCVANGILGIRDIDGSPQYFCNDDSFDISIQTPEKAAHHGAMEALWKDLDALRERGVPLDLFFDSNASRQYCDRGGEMGEMARGHAVSYPPERILEFAKIIEEYLTRATHR